MTYIDWFVNNVAKATWWRAKACQKYPNNCHFEGGVDVPLAVGTPVYALAGGNLMGAGTFNMALGGYGHGVVTVQTPIGQVYYQHIDLDSSIPHCKNGNCGGYQVQTGQLLGYSTSLGGGEVEVGINPTWGGIWGTNSDPTQWVADPRVPLESLAQGFFASGTGTGTTGGTGTSPQFNTGQSCSSECSQYTGSALAACLAGCSCASKLSQAGQSGNCCQGYTGTTLDACLLGAGFGAVTNTGDTTAGDPVTQLLDLVAHLIADPMRVLKFIFGIVGLGVALVIVFWPGGQGAFFSGK